MLQKTVLAWDMASIFWHGAGFAEHALECVALGVLLINYSQQFENKDSCQTNKAIPSTGNLTISNLWDSCLTSEGDRHHRF